MKNWAQLSGNLTYDYDAGIIHGGRLTVEQLADALSGINRYNGWTFPFWSVASHACLVAEIIAAMADYGTAVILEGLHHDDHEALVGDMVQPLKQSLSDDARIEYIRASKRAQRAIEMHIGKAQLGVSAEGVVKAADLAALEAERRVLFLNRIPWLTESMVNPKMLEAGQRIMAGDFAEVTGGPGAAARFVRHHHALMGRL